MSIQREREKAVVVEIARKLEVAKQRIPALVETLERLAVRQSLTVIRDHLWRLGEVTVSSSIYEPGHLKRIRLLQYEEAFEYMTPPEISPNATVELVAEMPELIPHRDPSGLEHVGYRVIPQGIVGHHKEELSVKAKYASYNSESSSLPGAIILQIISSGSVWMHEELKAGLPETQLKLKELLLEDCRKRGGHYDIAKQRRERDIERDHQRYKAEVKKERSLLRRIVREWFYPEIGHDAGQKP